MCRGSCANTYLVAFWDEVILQGHPLRDELISYLRDGVNVHDVFTDSFRGPSKAYPYNAERFPVAVFANHILSLLRQFRRRQDAIPGRARVHREVVRRGPSGPARPRMIQGLSVEETKPHLINDARPLNQRCKRIRFTMDTVARVANVASEGCFQGSLDDSSAFHHILLHPASWPLFGLEYRGVDYVWRVLPFEF